MEICSLLKATETVKVPVPSSQSPKVPLKTYTPDFSGIVSCKDNI